MKVRVKIEGVIEMETPITVKEILFQLDDHLARLTVTEYSAIEIFWEENKSV